MQYCSHSIFTKCHVKKFLQSSFLQTNMKHDKTKNYEFHFKFISNFYVSSRHVFFFFLTDVAYRKKNSFMFKKHSDIKNLREKKFVPHIITDDMVIIMFAVT